MAFLLDTNVCIDFGYGRSLTLLERMRAVGAERLAISAITYAELAVGARLAGEADLVQLDALVRLVAVRPFDGGAAVAYGRLIRAIGTRRNRFDHLIAAHAIALDVTLVTNNERDFGRIPGLRIENWTR